MLISTGCSTLPARPDNIASGDYKQVEEYISRLAPGLMKKHNVTGLSVALVDDKGIIWAKGFGWADKKNNVAATAETVYRVASISKLFTSTAVMQLAEQGKIDIDKPFKAYVPEFSIKTRFPEAGPVTTRNIMTHHSGLPANYYKGIFSKDPGPFTKVVDELKDEYAAYPTGYTFSYSNLAMSLLGNLIEHVSGKDFVSYMDESLLRPLDMANSSFSWKTALASAKGYKEGKENDDPYFRDLPAGGLRSNVLDMGHFVRMVCADGNYNGKQIIRKETLAEMLRPQNTDVPLDLNIAVGLGWALDGLGNTHIEHAGPVAHHGGGLLSFTSRVLVLPEQKIGVVVLSNSSTARAAVDIVATETLTLGLEAKSGIKQGHGPDFLESNKLLSPEELHAVTGHYATPIGMVKTSGKSGALEAEVLGNKLNLVPRVDGMLALRYKLWGLIPISLGELDYVGISQKVVAGHEVLLARARSHEMVFGEKATPSTISQAWTNRIGAYEVANAGDDIIFFDKVRVDQLDGFLVIEYALPLVADGTLRFPITTVSDTEAVILGLGGGMGETIEAITIDGREGFRYSGYQFKKVSVQ